MLVLLDKTMVHDDISTHTLPLSFKIIILHEGWFVGFLGVNCPFGTHFSLYRAGGWSGGAMVLGKLPVPGRPTIWMIVGQGPIVLAVGASGGCLDIFTLFYLFSSLSPSLWRRPDID